MSKTERETIFVSGKRNGGGPKRKLHTERDCPALKEARTVLERPRDVYPDDTDFCQWCTGDVERPETQDRSHYNALVAAAEAETEADSA